MYATKLHDVIVELLFELCNETKTDAGKPVYRSVYADHIGRKYRPIILASHVPKKTPVALKYNPDVWAQVKRKQCFDICEVWHSETEVEAVQDIVYSSLVDGIRYLHIVCTGENLTDRDAKNLVNLILRKIHDDEGKKLLDPTDVYITDLPQKLWNDRIKMKDYLKKKLKF